MKTEEILLRKIKEGLVGLDNAGLIGLCEGFLDILWQNPEERAKLVEGLQITVYGHDVTKKPKPKGKKRGRKPKKAKEQLTMTDEQIAKAIAKELNEVELPEVEAPKPKEYKPKPKPEPEKPKEQEDKQENLKPLEVDNEGNTTVKNEDVSMMLK